MSRWCTLLLMRQYERPHNAILALEPYFGGSHRAFLEGWVERSCHDWTVLTLPDRKWKWRMRHAAITFSHEVGGLVEGGESWDVIFCSDMLDLAGFLGLAPPSVRQLPAVAYFHENQLNYPVRVEREWDYHFAFSNITTALAAREAWFNSKYHRDEFLSAISPFLRRMPDHRPMHAADEIEAHAMVRYPGIAPLGRKPARREGPLRILWSARWEHDKDPAVFFDALKQVVDADRAFRVSVIGGGGAREALPVFGRARQELAGRIDHWGYQATRQEYENVLAEADVVVSTAQHEFFGLSVAEAVSAGAYPLLPKRLAYPEVLAADETAAESFFYEGGANELASRLVELIDRLESGELWQGDPERAVRIVDRFSWERLLPEYDDALTAVACRDKNMKRGTG